MLQWFLLWAGRLENQREYQVNYPNGHHLGNHQKHHPISKCSKCVKHWLTTRLNLTWQPYYFSDERTSKLFHPPVVCPPNFNLLQSSTFTQVRCFVLLLMFMLLLILVLLLMLMLMLLLRYVPTFPSYTDPVHSILISYCTVEPLDLVLLLILLLILLSCTFT